MFSALFALPIALALTASPTGLARADGLADEADLHFQLAAEHYQKGEFREALEHFLASNRLVPNKNVVFNIARTYEQLRRYADAHRYYTDALAAETNAQTIKDIQAALQRIAPNVAVLRVDSDPPGATIYIDRKDLGSRGRAPKPLAIAPGKYRIIIELDGYEAITTEVVEAKLGGELSIPVKLRRIVGKVHVAVEGAPSAEVHVGDEHAPSACTAPCDLDLAPGTHLLYFSRPGFQSVPRQVNVVAKQESRVSATMSPLTGSIVVSADEREAIVEIDNKPSGFTPAVIQNVPVGKRKIKVTLRGYAPVEREIEIKPNEQTELIDLQLTPLRQVSAVSRYTESIDDAPSSVTVIDGQELRAFGYPTIAESLRGVRGFSLSNDRAYFSAGIRGLGEPNDYGNRVLVLSDGTSLNDNLLNSSYIGSDGRVDLHDVERIEVVRGPGSLLYGTGAVSGLINLVPRAKDHPNGVFGGLSTYDNSVARARAGFHYNFSPNVGVWSSISAGRSNGIDIPVDLLAPGTGPTTQIAKQVDYFRNLGTAGRFWAGPVTVQWFFNTRRQNIPIGVFQTLFNDPRTYYQDTRMMLEVRFEKEFNQYFQLMVRTHANRYAFQSDLSYEPLPGAPLREAYFGTWFGVEARGAITPIKQLRITVGGEGQFHPQATLEGGFNTNEPYLNVNNPYNFGAAYLVLDANPTSWFRASAGARVDVYSTFGPIVVPRAALIFKPGAGVLKVMGGRAFRAPSIYEQFYTDGAIQFPGNQGSTKLKPESLFQGEVEYSHRFLENWVALGAGHASYVQNVINTLPDPNHPGGVNYQNSVDPAITAGGEVEIRREWRQGWMVSAMYGYIYTRTLPKTGEGERLVNAPEHIASLKGVFPVVPEIASIGLRTTLEAPRRLDQLSNDTTRPAIIADLTLSGGIKKYGINYTIGMYNVLDARYYYPVSDAYRSRTMIQNGRTFLADITVAYP